MAKIKAGARYRIIVDALHEVFNLPNTAAFEAEYEISAMQYAVFFPLAVRGDNGGWIRTGKERPCVNIPDHDGKGITQYAIGEPIHTTHDENARYAVRKKGRKGGLRVLRRLLP